MDKNIEYDVIVVGAGPGGSTCASLLAKSGLKTILVEKEKSPRFHIGESLLPNGNRLLKRIGVWEQIESSGLIKKLGGEFTYGDGSNVVYNEFAKGIIPGLDYAYQVERSKFDEILLNNARSCGCEVMQPAKIEGLAKQDNQWQVVVKSEGARQTRTLGAKWLIDASGSSTLLGKYLKIPRRSVPIPPRIAVFNHFVGVKRQTDERGGNIIITRIEDGWFWSIPLDRNRTSVGVVSMRRKNSPRDLAAFFYEQLSKSPFMADNMWKAKPQEVFRSAANFSYEYERFSGCNYFMVGDAAGFLDPVFSSGVYLAMESATLAADILVKHINNGGGKLPTKLQRGYTKAIKKRMRVMLQLINIFYNDTQFSVYMHPSNKCKLFQTINSIVSGNTKLSFSLAWRFQLFRLICRLNKHLRFAPEVKL